MSAYWIGRAATEDADGMRRYGALVQAAAESYPPGQLPYQPLVRGGSYRLLEGEDVFQRYAVLRFASVESALAYYHSPAYQEAAAVRRAACRRCDLAIVDGID